jgi:hypothetical protein
MIEDIFVSIVKLLETGCRIRGALTLIAPSKSRSGGDVVNILNQPGLTDVSKLEPPAESTIVHPLSNVGALNSSLKGSGLDDLTVLLLEANNNMLMNSKVDRIPETILFIFPSPSVYHFPIGGISHFF